VHRHLDVDRHNEVLADRDSDEYPERHRPVHARYVQLFPWPRRVYR
jgi:hypothetical protein